MRQNHIWRQCDQFGRMSADLAGICRGPPSFYSHVAANVPSQYGKTLQECPEPSVERQIIRPRGQKYADPPHPLGLLRARHERPIDRRAAEQGDEPASMQLIELHPTLKEPGLFSG
jgi:hypothetical protein